MLQTTIAAFGGIAILLAAALQHTDDAEVAKVVCRALGYIAAGSSVNKVWDA